MAKIAHYTFDRNFLDSEGNNNPVTSNGVYLSEGAVFEGQPSPTLFVETGHIAYGVVPNFQLQTYSISFWIRPTDDYVNPPSTKRWIAGHNGTGGGWTLSMGTNKHLTFQEFTSVGGQFRQAVTSGGASKKLQLNTWKHVVVAVDGAGITIYVDGVVAGSNSVSRVENVDYNATAEFFLGCVYDVQTEALGNQSGGDPFHGAMDDFQWYDHALSQADVDTLHTAGRPATITFIGTLQHRYWLNTDVADSYPQQYHGISTNVVFSGTNATFDGSSSAQITNIPTLNGNTWTVAFWAKRSEMSLDSENNSPTETLINQSYQAGDAWPNINNFSVYLQSGLLRASFRGYGSGWTMLESKSAGGNAAPWMDDGLWHHIAIVKSFDKVAMFIDGYLHDEESFTVPIVSDEPFMIGYMESSNMGFTPQNWFKGGINDLRIFSDSASALDIMNLYREGNDNTKVSFDLQEWTQHRRDGVFGGGWDVSLPNATDGINNNIMKPWTVSLWVKGFFEKMENGVSNREHIHLADYNHRTLLDAHNGHLGVMNYDTVNNSNWAATPGSSVDPNRLPYNAADPLRDDGAEWHHLLIASDGADSNGNGGNATIYIDGSLAGVVPYSGMARPWMLYSFNEKDDNPEFCEHTRDFRIYRGVPTQEEVQEIFNPQNNYYYYQDTWGNTPSWTQSQPTGLDNINGLHFGLLNHHQSNTDWLADGSYDDGGVSAYPFSLQIFNDSKTSVLTDWAGGVREPERDADDRLMEWWYSGYRHHASNIEVAIVKGDGSPEPNPISGSWLKQYWGEGSIHERLSFGFGEMGSIDLTQRNTYTMFSLRSFKSYLFAYDGSLADATAYNPYFAKGHKGTGFLIDLYENQPNYDASHHGGKEFGAMLDDDGRVDFSHHNLVLQDPSLHYLDQHNTPYYHRTKLWVHGDGTWSIDPDYHFVGLGYQGYGDQYESLTIVGDAVVGNTLYAHHPTFAENGAAVVRYFGMVSDEAVTVATIEYDWEYSHDGFVWLPCTNGTSSSYLVTSQYEGAWIRVKTKTAFTIDSDNDGVLHYAADFSTSNFKALDYNAEYRNSGNNNSNANVLPRMEWSAVDHDWYDIQPSATPFRIKADPPRVVSSNSLARLKAVYPMEMDADSLVSGEGMPTGVVFAVDPGTAHGCATFDGSSYIDLSHTNNLNEDEFTLGVWVKAESLVGAGWIASNHNGDNGWWLSYECGVGMYPDDRVTLTFRSASGGSEQVLTVEEAFYRTDQGTQSTTDYGGGWVHLMITRRPDGLEMWVGDKNGWWSQGYINPDYKGFAYDKYSITNSALSIDYTNCTAWIGRSNDATDMLNGSIRGLQFWDYSMGRVEIEDMTKNDSIWRGWEPHPPTLKIVGDNPKTVIKGSGMYTDEGIFGWDMYGVEIGQSGHHVSGDIVDTNVEGTYTLTYTIYDSFGMTSQAQRSVIVQEEIAAPSGGGDGGFSGIGSGEVFSSLLGRKAPPTGFYAWPDTDKLFGIVAMLNNGHVWRLHNGFPLNLMQSWVGPIGIPTYAANVNQKISAPGSLHTHNGYWYTHKPSGVGWNSGKQVAWSQSTSPLYTPVLPNQWDTFAVPGGDVIGAFYRDQMNDVSIYTGYDGTMERNFVYLHTDTDFNNEVPTWAKGNQAANNDHKSILDGHRIHWGASHGGTHVAVAAWRDDDPQYGCQRIFHWTMPSNDYNLEEWDFTQATGWTSASGIKRPRYCEALDKWFVAFGGWGSGGVLEAPGNAATWSKTHLTSAAWGDVNINDVGFARDAADTSLMAVGECSSGGVVFVSNDGGVTWQERINASCAIKTVLNVARGVWMIGCAGGSIAISMDDGYEFIEISTFKDDPNYGGWNGDVIALALIGYMD